MDRILDMSKDVMIRSQEVKEIIDDSIQSVESLDEVMKKFHV